MSSQLTFLPTGWFNLVKPFQYSVETVASYSVLAASPTFTAGPLISDITSIENRLNNAYMGDTSYTYFKRQDLGLNESFEVKFAPIDNIIPKYCTAWPDYTTPTNNLASSLQFLRSWNQATGAYTLTEEFQIFKGCRATAFDVVINGGIVDETANFSCREITKPAATTGYTGTPVYITNFTGFSTVPWTHVGNEPLST